MSKDNSISAVYNTHLESVKNLISHIELLEVQIKELQKALQDKEKEKQNFNSNWQKKCNHPEFFKITIPEERIPSAGNKNSKYYSLTKHLIECDLKSGKINPHPKMIFCKCSVCGLRIDEIESMEYVKELEIQDIRDYSNIDLKPISDFARNLYNKKVEEFTSLEREIKDLNSTHEDLQKELEQYIQEAKKIAEILNMKLGINHTEYIHHYPYIDPIYTDRFYKD